MWFWNTGNVHTYIHILTLIFHKGWAAGKRKLHSHKTSIQQFSPPFSVLTHPFCFNPLLSHFLTFFFWLITFHSFKYMYPSTCCNQDFLGLPLPCFPSTLPTYTLFNNSSSFILSTRLNHRRADFPTFWTTFSFTPHSYNICSFLPQSLLVTPHTPLTYIISHAVIRLLCLFCHT